VDKALTMLDESLLGAARSHVPAFVELGRRIRKNISDTEAAMVHKLANALIETTNTRLRVLHSMASGFKQPETPDRACPGRPRWLRPPRPGRTTG
jgi:transposase